ncbi:hypothetical protein QQX98_003043 [Neonectria punicea]|uniref:Orc1-like AAA ATPase domain-containing protein n=1 Tax=Neonectria punicea TaxID=979145 RepID=A0ABR1HFV8_9HYPO
MATDALEPLKGLLHRVRGVVSTVSRTKTGETSGLQIVRNPEHAEIDIVAVHGLGGEGFRSWITCEPKTKPKSWLEELLANDIPNARIMTYGYISDGANYRYLVRNVLYGRALDMVKELGAQRSRDDTARRPLFFIAHSLGGWIVKRALIISNEAIDPQLKDIELSTCGVAFFGTLSPGRPSSPSPLANVIRRTTSGFENDTRSSRSSRSSRSFSMQPQPGDIEWLENQMEAFKAITANLPRLSFHETMKSSDGFIVDKRHSMQGSDGAQIGLKATHSDLVKFQGRDSNYKTFIARFREMIDKGRTSNLLETKRKPFDLAAVHHLEYMSAGFAIPYKLPTEPSVIVPREDLIERLEAILRPPMEPHKLHFAIANLLGLPGTGKTTLARHFAEKHKDDISFVFWIWAESWETVVASYLEFANSLVTHYSRDAPSSQVENDLGLTGVEEMLKVKSILQLDTLRVKSVVRAVKDWLLRPENDKWLLIFDNVEPSYDIFDFIPLTLSGQIILTSRDSNCCAWGTKLHIEKMDDDQGVKLIGSVVGEHAVEDPEQADAALRIVQSLQHHPQSIAMAASTIRQTALTVADYQQNMGSRVPLHLLGSTIDQSPVTKTILCISAMLSTSFIPVALFSATSQLKTAPDRFMGILKEMNAFQDLNHVGDVLQHLLDENFIQASSPSESPDSSQDSSSMSSPSFGYFMLDTAARDHVRDSLTASEKVDNAWLACNVCVDGIRQKEVDSSRLPEIHDFGRIMAPHAKTCYDDWSSVLKGVPGDDDVAWQVLGNVCMTQGALEQAIGCFELALKQKGNMDPIDKIQTSLSLASLLQQANEVQRSQEVLSSINIASIDSALGFRVALAKASVAAARGELNTAEDQYESLEQQQEEAFGPTDLTTVGTVQKLAATLERLGKMEEAQALYRRVYISYQNLFGQSHPMTLEALEDLAHISKASNAIDEAERLYAQSVDIKTRTLGPQHPSTAHAIQKLAVIDDMRCRYADARAKYQKALDIMAPTLGRAHPAYTTTMENMALSARWHADSLTDEHGLGFLESRPADGDVSPTSSPRTASCAAAFELAESLYRDVLAVKMAAGDLYSNEHVLATGSKLREMYENEDFFASSRAEKVAELLDMLREGQREGDK